MTVLEQGSEADGASPQEGRGAQAGLRLQEAARGAGHRHGEDDDDDYTGDDVGDDGLTGEKLANDKK